MSSGSSGKLAQTTFETTPDDELAVVDVYESGSGGVENSFQDEYHSSDNDENQFSDIADSIAGAASDALGALSDVMGMASDALNQANALNNILNGLKNGNLGALNALTGGGSSALKGLSDLLRGVNSAVNTATAIGNSVNNTVNSFNNNPLINTVSTNRPLANQIQDALRLAGTIKSNSNSLSNSFGSAAKILGGDKSSTNSVYKGVVVRPQTLETPSSVDNKIALVNKDAALDKIKNINPEIAVCINDLPDTTQDALLRGFSDETINTGLIVENDNNVSRVTGQASSQVVTALSGIVDSFSKDNKKTTVQDPDALAIVISGTAHLASKAGIKNSFVNMTKDIDNKDIIIKASKPLTLRAISEGDIELIVELTRSKAAKELNSFSTDLIPQLTKNVKRSQDKSQQDFAPYYKDIKRAFTTINPHWDTYTTLTGKMLVNGCCISFNDFICDLIEACLNENNNQALNKTNRQTVKNYKLNKNVVTKLNPELVHDSFNDEVQKEVEKLNRDTYTAIFGDTTMIIPPPDVPDPTVEQPELQEPQEPTDFTNEPFLLIASVFLDNSVEAEMQKHFPFLNQRLSI